MVFYGLTSLPITPSVACSSSQKVFISSVCLVFVVTTRRSLPGTGTTKKISVLKCKTPNYNLRSPNEDSNKFQSFFMTLISGLYPEQNFFWYGWCSIYIFLSLKCRHTESLLLRMSRQPQNFKFVYQSIPTPPNPPGIPRAFDFCPVQWGIWPKMRLAQSGIWHSCQNAGQRHKQKDFVILCSFTSLLHSRF